MFYLEVLKDFRINGRGYYAGVYKFRQFVPHEYSANADRMWYETERGTVWYPKAQHRTEPVDMDEFFWIKLKAKQM